MTGLTTFAKALLKRIPKSAILVIIDRIAEPSTLAYLASICYSSPEVVSAWKKIGMIYSNYLAGKWTKRLIGLAFSNVS